MENQGKEKKKLGGQEGFPGGSAGKESACNVADLGTIPGWKDPLEKERLPTPVFWPGEFHGLYSPWGRKESDTTEWLSLHFTSGGQETNKHGSLEDLFYNWLSNKQLPG